ncbi:MAG: ribonuclease P protein component [Beijerinckiaceae bacterium]|nr:ribonuclease P protein component [Beijerinckiaceae bacterium]
MRDPDPASESLGPKASESIGRLKRRADFLRVAKGRRWHGKAFTLQALQAEERASGDDAAPAVRAGFTVTKKVGGSVVRNRARRRLREALRLCPDLPVRADHDYVIIARLEAIRLPFSTLQDDLTRALRGVHAEARPRDGAKPRDATKRPKRTTPSP